MMKKSMALFIIVFSLFFFGANDPFNIGLLIIPPVGPSPFNLIKETQRIDPLPLLRSIPQEYETIIENAASEAVVPIEILAAIIRAESEFNPAAVSPERNEGNRDMGICQFNSQYLQWYADMYNGGKEFDPMNPEEAIPIMALHIKWLHERYNHWPSAVMAYNAGFARVDSGNIPESTRDYLLKIYGELK